MAGGGVVVGGEVADGGPGTRNGRKSQFSETLIELCFFFCEKNQRRVNVFDSLFNQCIS